jgi:putative DNA primase/helicase
MLTNQQIAEQFILANPNLYWHTERHLFYAWSNHFAPLQDRIIERRVFAFIRTTFDQKNLTSQILRDVLKMASLQLPDDRLLDAIPDNSVAFMNVSFDLVNQTEFTPSPHRFTTLAFPYAYEEVIQAQCPVFKNFLKTSLVREDDNLKPDEELIQLMQEIFGNFLLTSAKSVGASFFVGDGANGKSRLADVAIALLGKQNISALSIQRLTTNPFAPATLAGKRLNVSNEEESKFLASDVFKALVSSEYIQAEKKFGDSFEFRPYAHFLFCTNRMPKFDGIDYGLKRRLLLIPFHRVFLPAERDEQLADKLLNELPGILAWALRGAKRLIDNKGIMSQPDASATMMHNLEEEISSAIEFFNSICELVPGETWELASDSWLANEDLYKLYVQWCQDNGRKPQASINFHRDIGKHIPGVISKFDKHGGVSFRKKNIRIRQADTDTINVETLPLV